MSITRTPSIDLDNEFEIEVPICKATVDSKTGKRMIVGVASGVAEDRDGERMSKAAVVSMVGQVRKGGVKLTSRHQQDWDTEIGDAVDAEYDPKTDELLIKTELPPEGVDPLADKAWRVANTEKVGFSVGGKLLKSFYERTELGKKRKVLDSIGLRHFALTKNPSYAPSFAQAVAKSFEGEAPADEEFTLKVTEDEDAERVEKDTTGSWASGSSESGGGNVGRDSVTGNRNAGDRKSDAKRPNTEDEGGDDSDENEELPKAKDERRLACPNCGHEFAADLPVEPGDQQGDDETKDQDDDDGDTGKSSVESPSMSKLNDTIDALKALAAGADDVTKSDEVATDDVAKAATTDNEIAKIVAASHIATEERIATLETSVAGAVDTIAKAIKATHELVADLPRGRKSTAVLKRPERELESGANVEKTLEQRIDEAPDALTALKAANEELWGIK